MSTQDRGGADFDAAVVALDLVATYVDEGRKSFDRSRERQLALVFLCANIGSQLKQLCRVLHIQNGAWPFVGPIQMRDRLVYGSVHALDPDIVWETCVQDGPPLRELIVSMRAAF